MGTDSEGGGEVGDAPLLSFSGGLFEVVLKTDLTATAPLFGPFVSFNETQPAFMVVRGGDYLKVEVGTNLVECCQTLLSFRRWKDVAVTEEEEDLVAHLFKAFNRAR